MSVIIGCKFTGKPKIHIDTESGAYWEALPPIQGHASLIQRALLAKPRPSLMARLVGIAQSHHVT